MTPRLQQLWTDFLEGDLSESDLAELDRALADDPDLLIQVAELYEVHRLTGLALQPFDADAFTDEVLTTIETDRGDFVRSVTSEIDRSHTSVAGSKSTPKNRWVGYATIAVLTLLLSIAAQLWLRPAATGRTSVRDGVGGDVATLIFDDDCAWTSGVTLGEGQRLPSGPIELNSGTAVIRFDGGAELVMTGRTALTLHSTARAELKYGNVVVRAEDGAEGFELTTPASQLIDLGTEFAVRVRPSGTTDVQVLDGQVEFKAGRSSQVLSAGEAVRLSKSGEHPEAVQPDLPRFDDVVRQAAPKPQPERMLAYEGFFYEPGPLPLEQTTKGKGWAGPWRLRTPEERRLPSEKTSRDAFDIVHGQLNVTWPVPGGRLGMLKLPPGESFYVRPLRKPIDLGEDSVTYFSLMVRETERPARQQRPRERLRLTFRSSDDYYADALSFGHGSGYRPRIQAGGGVLFTSPFVLPPEQTTLWVGKIVSRSDGEDEIYFRVYGEQDRLGYAEPGTWHVVTRGVDASAQLDRVLLSSTGTTARIVDELRIGPTWRSVAPISEEL